MGKIALSEKNIAFDDVNHALRNYSNPHKLENSRLLNLPSVSELVTTKGVTQVDALRRIIKEGIEYFRPKDTSNNRTLARLKYEILKMIAYEQATESQIMWDLGFDVYTRSVEEKLVDKKEPRFPLSAASEYGACSIRSYKRLKKEVVKMLKWWLEVNERGKNNHTDMNDKKCEFIEKNFFGRVKIKYVKGKAIDCFINSTVKSLRNSLKKYYVYSADLNTKIKLIKGFKDTSKKFRKFCSFDSWDSTSSTGAFAGAHKIAIPIKKLEKKKEREIGYHKKILVHYDELIGSKKRLKHGFYFRFKTDTHNAVLQFLLPNGKLSKIIKLIFMVEYKGTVIFSKNIRYSCNFHFSLNEYGDGWTKTNKRNTIVFWNIPRIINKGQIYKLRWVTERI